VVLARELTKKFEEFRRGKPAVLLAAVKARPLKGEFVVLIGAEAAESKCEAVPLVEARDSGPAARQSQISNLKSQIGKTAAGTEAGAPSATALHSQ
jgi:16S rRNA C1402 (ribose-2'-O) methylase RsmI